MLGNEEKVIIDLANSFSDSSEFINHIEKSLSSSRTEIQKAKFFEDSGNILFRYSFFKHTLFVLHHALKYYINLSDRKGCGICYRNLGVAYQSLGDIKKAIEYYEKGLSIFKEIEDKQGEGRCYSYLGYAYRDLDDFRKAIEYYEKGLGIAIQIRNKGSESKSYGDLGVAYQSLGDIKKAIEYYEKSLDFAIQVEDKGSESRNYRNLGVAYQSLGDIKKAIEYYEKGLSIFKEIEDKQGEGRCYTNLGNAYDSLGDIKKAIEYYEKGLSIFKEIEDKQGEGSCYTNLSLAYDSLGDFRKAIEYYEKSLDFAIQRGDKLGEGLFYASLGVAYSSLGDFRKAIEYYEKGLSIAKEIGDKDVEPRCYTNLGIAYRSLGDFRKAIEYYEKSVHIAKEIEDKQGEGSCYSYLGNAYQSLGDIKKAIEYQEKSLGIAKEIGNTRDEGSCYGNLGIVYSDLGNTKKAIEYHEKSLGIAIQIGDKRNEGRCYANIGNIYRILGDFRKAIEYHEKSLSIAIQIGDKGGESKSYGNLGNAYDSLGDFRKAIEYHEKSLSIFKEIEDKQGEGKCYSFLGIVYLNLGDIKKTIEYEEKGLGIAKEIEDKQGEGRCYKNLGVCYYSIKDYTQACYYLEKSIDILEKIGYDLLQEEHKLEYYGLQVNVYNRIINSFILSKNVDKAFEYLERSKSKTFNEIMSRTSHIRPSVKNISKEYQSLLDKEESLIAILKAIQIQNKQGLQQHLPIGVNFTSDNTTISTYATASIEHNSLESDDIINELSLVYDKIEKEFDPEYVFVRRSKSFPVSTIQDFIKDIKRDKNKNVIIVEYYYTSGINNKIHIFIVSSDKIDIKPVDIKDFNLDNMIDLYLKEISSAPPSSNNTNNNKANDDNNANEYLQLSSKELSHYLIDPISSYISNADLIYFVPYGKLHYIPLHALLLENKSLIVDHAVTYIPSASLLRFVKNKGTGSLTNCLSCGIVFKEEAREIVDIFSNSGYDSNSIYIEEPTKKQFIDKVNSNNNNNFDILHLSCHGFFNNNDPMASSLIFPSEFLRAREILDLKINSELVTLSACETGINENKPGEELVGLTRSFLYAGTPSVLVSLWKVHSETTRNIMIEFYRQLKNKKIDLATALQTAQKKIMQTTEHKHPYFWAPFVLVGDWE